MPLTLATWNVNSLKVRLAHLLDWLGAHAVDVVCLQETKLPDDKFPAAELQDAGYESVFSGQKTYNGVAILTRRATVGVATEVQADLPNFPDEQKRLLAATVAGVRVVCSYFPNGQAVGSDKYGYKLRWMAALAQWLREELVHWPQLALAGDFNVAVGLVDSFRLFEQPERSFTWWDYRMLAFRRKMGLRIDHILLSRALAARCVKCAIDIEPRRREQPSDHAPVILTLD